MNQTHLTLYSSLGDLYHRHREAHRAALRVGHPTPEHETLLLDCTCKACKKPVHCAIRFRFHRRDVTGHQLFPCYGACTTCGTPLDERSLLFLAASLQSLPAEPAPCSDDRPDGGA